MCMELCGCKASDVAPCGRSSGCIHVLSGEECGQSSCPAGDACQNQKLRRKDFPPLRVIYTPDRGRGVVCLNDVAARTVMTEYIGELINSAEIKRRKQIPGRSDCYVFKISDDLYIDAEYAGNLSRFINHSCEPNCLSEKIEVDGNTRIAIISQRLIKAVSSALNIQFSGNQNYSPTCLLVFRESKYLLTTCGNLMRGAMRFPVSANLLSVMELSSANVFETS